MRVIIILIICLIGFLLSFRNRSDYDQKLNNLSPENDTYTQFEMTAYNQSFEFTLFTMITWMLGQVSNSEMGIDNIQPQNLVNFVIFAVFILIMPILFMNIFQSISIDEVKDLIEKAQAEHVSNKIVYVNKINEFKSFIYEDVFY